MNFTQFIIELDNAADHPDLDHANQSPAARKRLADVRANRKAEWNKQSAPKKPIAAIPGSTPRALPSGGGALVKSTPKPSALVKTPKIPTPPKPPTPTTPRPQIKLPKPGPMHIDRPKKGGDLATIPKNSDDGGDGEKDKDKDKKGRKDKEHSIRQRLKNRLKGSIYNTIVSGPGEVGVAMGKDFPGAPQRNRGI